MYLVLILIAACSIPVQEEAAQVLYAIDGTESNIKLISMTADLVEVEPQSRSREKLLAESVNSIQFAAVESANNLEVTNSEKTGQINRVLLQDGSVVVAANLLLSADNLVVLQNELGNGFARIPRRNVKSILFGSLTPELERQWRQLEQANEQTADWLLFARDEVLDFVEGRVGEIDAQSVSFSTGDREATAPLQRVSGVVFLQTAGLAIPDASGILTTRQGSRLFIRQIHRADSNASSGASYVVQTACGAELTLGTNELVQLDLASLRSRFLSSINPGTIQWDPLVYIEDIYEFQARLNSPRFNESFDRESLKLVDANSNQGNAELKLIEYSNGIAIKGGTRMVFPLAGEFSRLEGIVGFAPAAPRDGQIELVLLGDGRDLYRKALQNRESNSEKIVLDVSGVERLTIQVNYHDGRNIGDVIHFCDVRVIR